MEVIFSPVSLIWFLLQLLLDVHAVKSVLLEMPNMGAEPKGNLPAAYAMCDILKLCA